MSRRPSGPVTAVLGIVAALVIVAGVVESTGASAGVREAGVAGPVSGRPVLVVMVPRSTWGDAPAGIDGWAAASLALHSFTVGRVSLDSYLTIGKGRRTRGPSDHDIGPLIPEGDGVRVADWSALVRLDAGFRYGGDLGALGQALRDHHVDLTLVTSDPAAAGAAADERGVVQRFVPYAPGTPAARTVVGDELAVDKGVVMVETPLAGVDDVLASRDGHCTVVMSVSSHRRFAQLGMFAVSPECGLGTGRLVGPSTRQPGYVSLPDVAPTVLSLVGVNPSTAEFDGGPVTVSGTTSLGELLAANRRSVAGQRASVPFLWLLLAANAVGALVFLAFPRTRRDVVAVLLALPVSSLLMMLVPWADWGTLPGLLVAVGFAVVAAYLARRVSGDDAMLLVGLLTLFTALVIGIDGATGGHLELDAPMANNAIGAGRFAGIGNVPFGFFVAACIVAAVVALDRWGDRAVVPVAAALGVAALVDGAPFLGADVGGLLAALPAFALLVVLCIGRISFRRVLGFGVAAAAVIGGLALFDLSRGEGGSHLARSLTGGRLGNAIARKGLASLRSYSDLRMTALAILTVVIVAVCWRRVPRRRPLVAGFWALLTAAVLGSVLNDSGVAVAAAIGTVTIACALTAASLLAAAEPLPPPPR